MVIGRIAVWPLKSEIAVRSTPAIARRANFLTAGQTRLVSMQSLPFDINKSFAFSARSAGKWQSNKFKTTPASVLHHSTAAPRGSNAGSLNKATSVLEVDTTRLEEL